MAKQAKQPKFKHDWQDKDNQAVVECSLDECNVRLTIRDDKPSAIQQGWAVHNGEWICPTHRAALDAPKEEAARAEQERLAKEAAELASKIARSIELGKLAEETK